VREVSAVSMLWVSNVTQAAVVVEGVPPSQTEDQFPYRIKVIPT
jgi:hypothetical protein